MENRGMRVNMNKTKDDQSRLACVKNCVKDINTKIGK